MTKLKFDFSLSSFGLIGKMSNFDIILDNSQQNLKEVPKKILEMTNLKMLYLQQNFIREIPENFFQRLPHLTWLDLRNNHISTIPKGVANHQHLENLLLSENKIEVLPNELGSLPKLKVLQLGNNPLKYPTSRVVAEGTKALVAYLKHQLEKEEIPMLEPGAIKNSDLEEDKEVRIEKEIRVMADYFNEYLPVQQPMDSSLVVKSLSKVKRQDSGIVHKMTTTPSKKILLRSYYDDDDKFVKASTQTDDSITYIPSFKQSWMEKLRQLLQQQEKILQQERNLQALTSWRTEKKAEPVRNVDSNEYRINPPYATDPQYKTILSREDLHKEIDKMIQHTKNPPKEQNVEKLISDLVSQLKEMETSYGDLESPRGEIEAAGSQIMKIMEMHKKIMELQNRNNLLLQ